MYETTFFDLEKNLIRLGNLSWTVLVSVCLFFYWSFVASALQHFWFAYFVLDWQLGNPRLMLDNSQQSAEFMEPASGVELTLSVQVLSVFDAVKWYRALQIPQPHPPLRILHCEWREPCRERTPRVRWRTLQSRTVEIICNCRSLQSVVNECR